MHGTVLHIKYPVENATAVKALDNEVISTPAATTWALTVENPEAEELDDLADALSSGDDVDKEEHTG